MTADAQLSPKRDFDISTQDLLMKKLFSYLFSDKKSQPVNEEVPISISQTTPPPQRQSLTQQFDMSESEESENFIIVGFDQFPVFCLHDVDCSLFNALERVCWKGLSQRVGVQRPSFEKP